MFIIVRFNVFVAFKKIPENFILFGDTISIMQGVLVVKLFAVDLQLIEFGNENEY